MDYELESREETAPHRPSHLRTGCRLTVSPELAAGLTLRPVGEYHLGWLAGVIGPPAEVRILDPRLRSVRSKGRALVTGVPVLSGRRMRALLRGDPVSRCGLGLSLQPLSCCNLFYSCHEKGFKGILLVSRSMAALWTETPRRVVCCRRAGRWSCCRRRRAPRCPAARAASSSVRCCLVDMYMPHLHTN